MEQAIKTLARELGFAACGIAEAAPVDAATAEGFRRWIAEGCHGDMGYMARNVEKRLDPTLLVPGCRSLIVVALSYCPSERIPDTEYQLSCYAYGRDYHEVVKEKLHLMMQGIPELNPARAFVDTAPLLERYWAQKAGIGWTGRNHQLIIPHAGSYFFLGIIATGLVLHPDAPCPNRCGNCRRCVEACPTGALGMSGNTIAFDARRCVSYQTIEQKSPISSDFSLKMGNRIYGCDTCQRVCPWNRFAKPTAEEAFRPSPELLSMTRRDWQQLTPERYEALFAHSAVSRAGYEGLMRNIRCLTAQDENE